MKHKILSKNNQEEVATLFSSVFTSSEGEKEGKLIGNLASKLASGIDNGYFCITPQKGIIQNNPIPLLHRFLAQIDRF